MPRRRRRRWPHATRHLDGCGCSARRHGNGPEGCDGQKLARARAAVAQLISAARASESESASRQRQAEQQWLGAGANVHHHGRCRRRRFRHVAIHYAHVAVGINMIDLRRRRRRRRRSYVCRSSLDHPRCCWPHVVTSFSIYSALLPRGVSTATTNGEAGFRGFNREALTTGGLQTHPTTKKKLNNRIELTNQTVRERRGLL